ncbi:hypothetical protein H310_00825 [Aphanomyces invadans]|uniref:Uncharacterized protein n=1 Tax=Aphanomyces invadans TaxID=157072 RepID=A0A024UXX5_9STRA|nr:hypothetical protein H310_00825 [Aphanomyces invadans]ETW10558.1 hypothetical protein H310_00825 [Aphanomyces invadans]|eukprot:XP_008861969.1 hypothetical protein H310_00825 [Aphanomyces invadans]
MRMPSTLTQSTPTLSRIASEGSNGSLNTALNALPDTNSRRNTFIKCRCSSDAMAGGSLSSKDPETTASSARCPLHDVVYMHSLPVDRPKLACIPPQSSIRALPPFILGEVVYLYGGLPQTPVLHASPRSTPAILVLHKDAHDKCLVTVVEDDRYQIDGTFSVQTEGGIVYHGISGLRLEPTGTAIETPRYVDTFVHNMGRRGIGLRLRDLSTYMPHQLEHTHILTMLEKYSKLIRLNYESNRNMAVILSRRATLYAALGHYSESLEDAEQAIRLEPNFTTAYFRKGYALCSLGRYAEACVEFRRGLEFDACCPHLRHALQVTMNSLHLKPTVGNVQL